MVVLFGVLNNKFIATHTSIPFADYFDPRLLCDLANDLQVQIVSCNSDGLRYAFILERGEVEVLPTHIDIPFVDHGDRLLVSVVYSDKPVADITEPQSTPGPVIPEYIAHDRRKDDRGVGAFLKVFDDIQFRDDAALQSSAQNLPNIVVIDKDEFNRRVAEHEATRQMSNRIKQLLGGNMEISKKMQQAMLYALVNDGKLYHHLGGFWAMENWRAGQHPWFGTSTVDALVSRGLMSYTKWQEGENERFPIAAIVLEAPAQYPQSIA